MCSGETIKVLEVCGKEVEINAVVIYPLTNKYRTMYWKVEGMFGSCRYTLCITQDKQKALECFEKVNNELLEVHERDLATRL